MPKPTPKEKPRSPTIEKVISTFVEVLRADNAIDDVVVMRLSTLLENRAAIKPDDIRNTLFPAIPSNE